MFPGGSLIGYISGGLSDELQQTLSILSKAHR